MAIRSCILLGVCPSVFCMKALHARKMLSGDVERLDLDLRNCSRSCGGVRGPSERAAEARQVSPRVFHLTAPLTEPAAEELDSRPASSSASTNAIASRKSCAFSCASATVQIRGWSHPGAGTRHSQSRAVKGWCANAPSFPTAIHRSNKKCVALTASSKAVRCCPQA